MWREIKNKPAMFLGQKSIIRLALFLCGINYAFGKADHLSYFKGFNDWYMKKF